MSKYFKKNNEKSARSHPRLRKNASRLLALTTSQQQQHTQQQQIKKVLLGHRSRRL